MVFFGMSKGRQCMTGYKDKTFCPYFILCKTPCDRALTNEVKEEMKKQGVENVYVYTGLPECFVRWFE